MSLHCSLIQTDILWEAVDANLQQLSGRISQTLPTQLVLLPEAFATGFTMNAAAFSQPMDGSIVRWMKTEAVRHRIILAGSAFILDEEGKAHNRFLWVMPNGDVHYYNKRHLFSFGNEDENYTSGNRQVVVQANGIKLKLQVCYDLRFPVWARQRVEDGNPEYDVLVYVANWPQKRIEAWKALLVARAIENQCYVLAVNRTGTDGAGIAHNGQSCIIDPLGQVVWQGSDRPETGSITIERQTIDTIRRQFPFLRDADTFSLMR